MPKVASIIVKVLAKETLYATFVNNISDVSAVSRGLLSFAFLLSHYDHSVYKYVYFVEEIVSYE